VIPELRKGLDKAGRSLEDFDVVAAVPSAVTPEPDEARDKLRQDLTPYFSLPFYRAMLERSGYEDDIKGFDEAMQSGDAKSAVARISDRFLNNLGAIGSAEEAAESLGRYQAAGASSPCVGAVAGTDFSATLEALAGSLG
jgi:alkanesulfonate monooxygenase SsuD/methylene tetrahydromethanopterin reductase-like flavin-dependent oxidoreductase (luciferase family)